ncbi:putative leader peptide [Pseudonocardia saturnea]
MRAPMDRGPDKWHPGPVTSSMPAPLSGAAALGLRLVGRRHVDLSRVSSAICR